MESVYRIILNSKFEKSWKRINVFVGDRETEMSPFNQSDLRQCIPDLPAIAATLIPALWKKYIESDSTFDIVYMIFMF